MINQEQSSSTVAKLLQIIIIFKKKNCINSTVQVSEWLLLLSRQNFTAVDGDLSQQMLLQMVYTGDVNQVELAFTLLLNLKLGKWSYCSHMCPKAISNAHCVLRSVHVLVHV